MRDKLHTCLYKAYIQSGDQYTSFHNMLESYNIDHSNLNAWLKNRDKLSTGEKIVKLLIDKRILVWNEKKE